MFIKIKYARILLKKATHGKGKLIIKPIAGPTLKDNTLLI